MFPDEIDVAGSPDEGSAIDAEEVQTPEGEDQPEADNATSNDAEEVETEESLDDSEEADAEGDDQPDAESEPDTVTVEFDGEEYEVPSVLKDALMRDKDYTQKTQAHAEEVRERTAYFAEREENLRQYQQISQNQTAAVSYLQNIDQQLRQFEGFDWNRAFDEDLGQATKLKHQVEQLQAQRGQVVQQIEQGEQARQMKEQEYLATTAAQTRKDLARQFPTWDEKREAELTTFAKDVLGFTDQALARTVEFGHLKGLHYAEIGYRAEQEAKKAAKPAPKPAKPLVKRRAKRNIAPKSLDRISDPNEYEKAYLAQKAKRAKG